MLLTLTKMDSILLLEEKTEKLRSGNTLTLRTQSRSMSSTKKSTRSNSLLRNNGLPLPLTLLSESSIFKPMIRRAKLLPNQATLLRVKSVLMPKVTKLLPRDYSKLSQYVGMKKVILSSEDVTMVF